VLEDDTVPLTALQDNAARCMQQTWELWSQEGGRDVMVSRNLAVRWDRDHPRIGVDADVCLLDPPPATPIRQLDSLRLWEQGNHAPRVALEIVSEETAPHDYRAGIHKHAASGTRELWVFDPQRHGPNHDGGPWLLQVWERDENNTFCRVYAGDGPFMSRSFGAWLVVPRGGFLLRLSDDAAGTSIWPTYGEVSARLREESAEIEAETARLREETAVIRAEKESALARADQERAAKERALARVAEVEALLAAMRVSG
jgi:hypothetical protein